MSELLTFAVTIGHFKLQTLKKCYEWKMGKRESEDGSERIGGSENIYIIEKWK